MSVGSGFRTLITREDFTARGTSSVKIWVEINVAAHINPDYTCTGTGSPWPVSWLGNIYSS